MRRLRVETTTAILTYDDEEYTCVYSSLTDDGGHLVVSYKLDGAIYSDYYKDWQYAVWGVSDDPS